MELKCKIVGKEEKVYFSYKELRPGEMYQSVELGLLFFRGTYKSCPSITCLEDAKTYLIRDWIPAQNEKFEHIPRPYTMEMSR